MLTREKVEQSIPKPGDEFDVIVVGGGPAGLGAALAARHVGAKTLILEASSTFGGIAMACLWMPVNRVTLDYVTPEGGKRGGVFDTFVAAIKKYGPEAYTHCSHPPKKLRGGISVHPEYLRIATFDMLEEAGCYYRLYSPVFAVVKEGNVVTGVQVTTKDGTLETFKGKVIIDCTGDGDVSLYAGVEMQKGRENDGLFMPPALLWAIGNVDVERNYEFQFDQSEAYEALLDEMKKRFSCSDWYELLESSLPNTLTVNNGGPKWSNLDMTQAADMTVAERMGIQHVMDFMTFVREGKWPGLENATLLRAGYRVAARDTRRIVGEYLITHEDALNATEFEDIVSRKYGFIDAVGYFQAQMKSGHPYPYRCLVPAKVDGLLVAGRCASATHLGFASGRGMGENMGMGQAAGVAAAVSVEQGVLPRNVDVKKVQEIIRASGVKL